MVELICLVFLSCPTEPLFEELRDLNMNACYQGSSYSVSFRVCSEGYQSQDLGDFF